MKNNISNAINIVLLPITIFVGYLFLLLWRRGFNIMYAAISTLLALKPFICSQYTNDSNRDKKQLDRHPMQKEKKRKK